MTKFKKIRLDAGLSQTQAAKLLKRNITTIARWDRGEVECSELTLIAFQSLISNTQE